MTHYDVDYSKLQEPEKSNKALADIKDYVGEERFNKITEALRAELRGGTQEPRSWDQFKLVMSFAGIQGFPCQPMYVWVYGEKPDMKEPIL